MFIGVYDSRGLESMTIIIAGREAQSFLLPLLTLHSSVRPHCHKYVACGILMFTYASLIPSRPLADKNSHELSTCVYSIELDTHSQPSVTRRVSWSKLISEGCE